MTTAATLPREDRRAALNHVLLRLEALETEAAELRGLVQRLRRQLDGDVVLPILGARWLLLSRRRALKLSQAQVGREAGLSRSQVQSLEAGSRSGHATMAALVAALTRLEGTTG